MAELSYHPVLGDLDQVLSDGSVDRVLILDGDVPDAAVGVSHRRWRDNVGTAMPTGIYRFALDDGDAVMAIAIGGPPGQPTSSTWAASDEDSLIQAYGWMEEWWAGAAEIAAPKFKMNDDVLTVPDGQEARIRSRSFMDGEWWYRVRVGGRTVEMRERSVAEPPHDDGPEEWIERAPTDARRFAATLTRAKLSEQLTDTVYSFRATRTIFRPYQFRPIMRLLESGQHRLLIADEVGLGKTIEAGLVWTEFDARNQANRVLVVCPSMLVPKWRAEMYERFSYEVTELTKDASGVAGNGRRCGLVGRAFPL